MLTVHQTIYDRSGGRIGHRILGTPTLLLRTTGAKTRRRRTSALTYARDGDTYLVAASMGGSPRAPGWYYNLRADPGVEIQIGRRRIPVRARAVQPTDPDYQRLWDVVNANNHDRYRGYQRLTARPIPVVVLMPPVN
ncbi:nitroreductase family deazaflavin-dependent oxidoreductase [Sporichthya sp.]|uniref:nitroreductase family deazaflavin-dependent oxidoreductase n=1 Tax=Sporichthya sp. TaxID=65475 RepID=UPI0017A698BC|nr:nitroreductase family deazaflavin-dependent oxidoreductase [Sporichthya sp.]